MITHLNLKKISLILCSSIVSIMFVHTSFAQDELSQDASSSRDLDVQDEAVQAELIWTEFDVQIIYFCILSIKPSNGRKPRLFTRVTTQLAALLSPS